MANTDNTGANGKPPDRDAGWRETAAASMEGIPLIGSVLAAMLRASKSVRRGIAMLLFLIVIYPVLSLFAALWAVHLLPGDFGVNARSYVLHAVDFDSQRTRLEKEEYDDINSSNHMLDGSVLLPFSVDDYRDELYIYNFVSGQTIQFYTYQVEKSRGDLPVGCSKYVNYQIQNSPPDDNVVGTLSIGQVGTTNATSVPVPLSVKTLTNFFPHFDDVWKEWGMSAVAPQPVVLKLTFKPSQEIIDKTGGCERFDTYVIMTYSKRILP